MPDTPTPGQIEDAAVAWCGMKDRETFPEDLAYFRHNWRYLPGMKAFVEEFLASLIDEAQAARGEGE